MNIVLGLVLSGAVLLGGVLAGLFVLVSMTGCDLRIRANMLALCGCMGFVVALVSVGLWLAWRLALR